MLEAIILGFVQGLTEFLPISSSAHLRILGEFLPNAADPGAAFTAITQLGTETAVVVFFWRDIVRIVSHWFRAIRGKIPHDDPDARMGWLIIIGSIPIVVLGLLFQDQIETTFRSLYVVATMLIVFGIVLGLADWAGAKRRKLEDLTYPHGLYFGLAQSLALIPGVSRSGGTITMGLLLGYERAAAARYAFLLAIPAVFGSGFYQLFMSMGEPAVYGPVETAVATAVAFGVAILIIAVFMKWISRHSFLPFVIYRIALGATILILLGVGVLEPF
ncbi:undecaprenyl-diphosphatase [Agromyces flavus]|uniref:Undecaprenyl-diphosphatase n=1 Tax=Agromyces flavus TaxID=589382 RepID=A0A1H1RGD5_9MICO|nr:undecaprenyl-diphosphate phosphatase [Agromyces flavus]MCP2368809.1 undecaprenyl-diphosphatase [Agromyces flavus]GGI48265.1 undecaprenyl-diphosphatase 2 [Agromyces flavus]SDS34804.1 Undecaprenyl-diphosphatase [Agromyces flavus]